MTRRTNHWSSKPEKMPELKRWKHWSVYLRDKCTCVYCGFNGSKDLTSWWNLELDHLVPQAERTAENSLQIEDEGNRVVCCRTCNFLKRDFVMEGWTFASELNDAWRESLIAAAKIRIVQRAQSLNGASRYFELMMHDLMAEPPDQTTAIAGAMKCLDDFMAAFNARDLVAWEKTFNCPSVRLASNQLVIVDKPGWHPPDTFTRGALKDWHHSAWERREVIHAGPDKVHIDTRFVRYRADGSEIGHFDSVYVVTKENGHWGVKVRSSFAP